MTGWLAYACVFMLGRWCGKVEEAVFCAFYFEDNESRRLSALAPQVADLRERALNFCAFDF